MLTVEWGPFEVSYELVVTSYGFFIPLKGMNKSKSV
jgi:hypothetical protein